RHGLPLSVSTHAANHHEVRLVQLCFDFYMIEAKPENLIGDRAYDSDALDDELRSQGIEMIAPHRSNRVRSLTQDGRRLRRYTRRWLVERFFAWIQRRRRLLGPLGVLSAKLPRLRPARLPADPVSTILR
ncbi:transposase, partial [Bradyrhizobium ottawaense]|uniref:transposase n=1 Tax=Bradyrhizobium ottawaense TaxID=931866 RepID=UPI001AEC7365